jgi:hypothetical protein
MSGWTSEKSGEYFAATAYDSSSKTCLYIMQKGSRKGQCCGHKTIQKKELPVCSSHVFVYEIEKQRFLHPEEIIGEEFF